MSVEFKKGDTADPLQGNLQDQNGNADISGFQTVKLYMRNVADGTKKIDGKTMTVLDENTGNVKYEWDAEDVDTTGVYEAEIVVDYGTPGGKETFPSDGFKSIQIVDDIEES